MAEAKLSPSHKGRRAVEVGASSTEVVHEEPRLRRVRVRVTTPSLCCTGYVTLPKGRNRVSDLLNDPTQFLPLTSVEIVLKSVAQPTHQSFMLVNKLMIETVEEVE